MIVLNDNESTISGKAIDLIAELGIVTEQVISTIQKDIPREEVVDLVNYSVRFGIEFSGMSEEERRMRHVAIMLREMQNGGRKDED